MKKIVVFGAMLTAMTALGVPQAEVARAAGSTLLVIPSRYTVVQFAFDVASKRSLYLLSYDQPATGGEAKLYAWDNGSGKWIETRESDVSSGALFRDTPAQVVLVGDIRTLPDSVSAAVDPNGKAKRIKSLNLVDIANGLDDVLNFNAREWKWFASRYGFTLDDRNAERRRWGRYGPPGGDGSSRAPAASQAPVESPDDVVMPVSLPDEALEPEPEQESLVIQVPRAEPQSLSAEPGQAVVKKGVPVSAAAIEPDAPAEVPPVGVDVNPENK